MLSDDVWREQNSLSNFVLSMDPEKMTDILFEKDFDFQEKEIKWKEKNSTGKIWILPLNGDPTTSNFRNVWRWNGNDVAVARRSGWVKVCETCLISIYKRKTSLLLGKASILKEYVLREILKVLMKIYVSSYSYKIFSPMDLI